MFEREQLEKCPACPRCGRDLRVERDLLVCAEHGKFFAYGPRLLVRAPHGAARERTPAMPWEMNFKPSRTS
jgi:hypothetical protein